MRLLSGVLIILFICRFAASKPIFDRDGPELHHRVSRAAGFGETIRDWFRILKDRIVGKWQEWFGTDNPTPRLSPQDILNIDKTIEARIPGYPGLFLDLSSLSFDSKRDWGVRVGNWYIIRKVTGNDYDSDSDEWDARPLIPNLPSPWTDWTPDFRKFGTPEAARPPTTPKIETTTPRQQTIQTVAQTQSVLIPTQSVVTEATTETSTESVAFTTQLITTTPGPIVEPIPSEEILTSNEFITNSNESTYDEEDVRTESIITSTESIVPSVGSTVFLIESSSDPKLTNSVEISNNVTESIVTSTEESTTVIVESSTTATELASVEISNNVTESIVTSTEESTTVTVESPTTATELALPIFNKRIEENEINKRTTRKPRPASAEVVLF